MKIWILRRKDQIGYDEYDGKVVVAEDEWRARDIANRRVGDEGRIWDDPTIVICDEVDNDIEGIVLASFCAG